MATKKKQQLDPVQAAMKKIFKEMGLSDYKIKRNFKVLDRHNKSSKGYARIW